MLEASTCQIARDKHFHAQRRCVSCLARLRRFCLSRVVVRDAESAIAAVPQPTYRGRLAPSPTGGLHLGIARTALVAWLRARKQAGALVMRVEDIDTPRVVADSARAIMDDMRWLGLDWDEGPDVAGPYAPYEQSQRTQLYADALHTLAQRGYAYPCTCSRKDIASVASAPHGDLGALYPGTCRNGARASERPAALRFKHQGPAPTFCDLLHGPYRDPVVDDFVLRRGDGMFAYQLAVVVDDIAMQVSEVVRGDDLLSSTPRQLALYAALGAPAPQFVHVPLLLGPEGTKLSKRHQAPAIAEYRAHGVSAPSIIGWLAASLGLLERPEPVRPAELVADFELARLPLTAATLAPSLQLPALAPKK
jgi:glutamyl-tRNA synthetase